MPENPVRTVYGLEHLNQTTATERLEIICPLGVVHRGKQRAVKAHDQTRTLHTGQNSTLDSTAG